MAINLLIAEDDAEWCKAYARAAGRVDFRAVKVAKNLAEAGNLIDEMQFAVALVDIALDELDDRNTDGLHVMEKIRRAGDDTSIVVVTGRVGMDVLPITRDSIMKYEVFEILHKTTIVPTDISKLLQRGAAAFQERNPVTPAAVRDALRGNLGSQGWDAWVLGETNAKNGAQGLYSFLGRLLADFCPLLPADAGEPVKLNSSAGLFHGSFWSRSAGQPVVVCFAGKERAEQAIEAAKSSSSLLSMYHVGAMLKECSEARLGGAVFALEGVRRQDFGRLPR